MYIKQAIKQLNNPLPQKKPKQEYKNFPNKQNTKNQWVSLYVN